MEQLASNLYPFTSSFNETSQTTNSANENAFFGDFGKNDTFLSGSENDDPFGMNDFGSIPKKNMDFLSSSSLDSAPPSISQVFPIASSIRITSKPETQKNVSFESTKKNINPKTRSVIQSVDFDEKSNDLVDLSRKIKENAEKNAEMVSSIEQQIRQYTEQALQVSKVTSNRLIKSLSEIPDDFSDNKKSIMKVMNLYRDYISELIKRISKKIREKDRDIKLLKLIVQNVLNRTAEFLQEMILLHDSSNKDLAQLSYIMNQMLHGIRMDNYTIEKYNMLDIEKQIVFKKTTEVMQSSQMVVDFFLQWIRFSKEIFSKIAEHIKMNDPSSRFMSDVSPYIQNFQNVKSMMEAVKCSSYVKDICFNYMEETGKKFEHDFQTFITINLAKTLYAFSIHTLIISGLVVRTIERSQEHSLYKTNGQRIINDHQYIEWKKIIDFIKNQEIFNLWINEINVLKNQYLH